MLAPTVQRTAILRYEALSRHFGELLQKCVGGSALTEPECRYLRIAPDFLDQLLLAMGDEAAGSQSVFGLTIGSPEELDVSLFYALQAWYQVSSSQSLPAFSEHLHSYKEAIEAVSRNEGRLEDKGEALKGALNFFKYYNEQLARTYTI